MHNQTVQYCLCSWFPDRLPSWSLQCKFCHFSPPQRQAYALLRWQIRSFLRYSPHNKGLIPLPSAAYVYASVLQHLSLLPGSYIRQFRSLCGISHSEVLHAWSLQDPGGWNNGSHPEVRWHSQNAYAYSQVLWLSDSSCRQSLLLYRRHIRRSVHKLHSLT